MKGIGRWELRSGTSSFVPRGTFSMSHWPRGLRGRVFSSHTAAGTTTNGFLVPMRYGPSSSAKRSTSDRQGLASAMVQTRLGSVLFTVIFPAPQRRGNPCGCPVVRNVPVILALGAHKGRPYGFVQGDDAVNNALSHPGIVVPQAAPAWRCQCRGRPSNSGLSAKQGWPLHRRIRLGSWRTT